MSVGSAGRALAFAELGLAKLEDAALAILRQGDPTNARRSELASELGKKARGRALRRVPRPRAVADRARGARARRARRANARSTLMPRRASSPRSRRACRSTRRRRCSSSAGSSPTVAEPRFLEALGAPPLGPAQPWPSPSTSPPRSAIPTGRRTSATPMRRSPPTRSRASSAQQGRDVRFQTGTDEHGLKMAQAARARRRRAARVCGQNVASFPGDVRHS